MRNALIALIAFLGIAAFFLWKEHEAHILGALPYALLLLCIGMHFFMHGAHGGHSGDQDGGRGADGGGEPGRGAGAAE